MLLRNLFEDLTRTGQDKSAVVGWGRGMGHKGHMFLASSVITQATETSADPYFVVSRTVGKDDPITPEEKLAIYKKVFPQSGHIFQTATEEMPDLTRVLSKLQNMGYTDVTVVVGADQVNALGYVKNYNGKPDKAGNIPFSFNTLNVISRQETNDPSRDQEGPRATPMRAVLMDPAKSEEEKFAVWRDAMNPELSDEEVMDLMHKAEQRMKAMVKPKKKAAEEGLDNPWGDQGNFAGDTPFNIGGSFTRPKLEVGQKVKVNAGHYKGIGEIEEIKGDQARIWMDSYARSFVFDLTDLSPAFGKPVSEGTSIESTLRAVINDIGEPITSVYDAMKFQAKKYVDNHGELDRGFRMVAAGIGGRWVQNMYVGRLQNELYDLCKYNTRRTVELREFLRGVETDGELEMKRSFGNIANNLPTILARLGQHLNAPQLTKNANRWMQNKAAYEDYIANLEAEDDYEEPAAVKSPKSNVIGQQNVQVDQIVNNVLGKLPSKIQGDIRNAIARAPNKLQALQAELQKRGVKAPMEEATFKKSPYGRTAASQQRAKELLNPPKPPEPKKDEKDVEEAGKKKSRSKNKLSKYFFPGYGYYGYGGSDDSGEGGGDGGEGLNEDDVRAEAQAAYMQGQCMILAIAINQLNPKRYPIGYIWEYNMSAGAPDMEMDDDEWEYLSPEEQEEISKDISRHSVVHAYVQDQETNEYIDARGRHRTLPNLWGSLGVTRFDEFPGTARELIDITAHGDWDEASEQVSFKRGRPAFDSLAGPAGVKRAQDYAVKYLGVEGNKNKAPGTDQQGVAEGFPQPGESSGKAKQFNPNAKVQTKEMTLDQILGTVKGIPYVNNVVDDWDAKDYSWGVTKKVIEYAKYLQKNPQSVANLPPLVVIDGQLNDGAHRLSAINLLQKRMDPKNPLWKQVKLKVQFGTSADVASEQGVAEGFDIGQEWMSDTELDQYVPERLQQQWRELLGYDENGNPSALWANLTGGYEPDVNDPQHRRLMVKVANKWFAAKKIPNVKFFDVKDADDELEWLVQIGQQGVAENYHSDLMKQTYAKFFKPAPPKTVLAVKKFLSDVIISLGTAQDNDYNDNDEEISWEQDLSDVREAYGKLRSNTSPNWFDIADAVLSYDTEFRESMLEWAEEELGSKLVDFLWDEVWEAKHKISRADGSYNIDVGHQDASGQQSDRDSYKPWDPEKDPPKTPRNIEWKVMINGEQKIKFGGVSNNQEAAMKVATNWARSHGYEREVQAGNVEVVQVQQGVAEARRNPEQNRKSGSGKYDLINFAEDNITDKDNWAVSMTMEPKLGVNPQAAVSEDTPKGIYFYPLRYFMQLADRDESLPWGDNMPYLQLFQYDRSGEMTQQTKVDPARLKQALLQYCPEEVIQQAIDEPEYDGTPYWFIYDCLSRLGKSDETNVVRWNKVLRDLGFTSVYDPGKGWIAYNEPTQGVVLDPRIIKQHKMFDNRNPTLQRRRYDIQGLADAIGWSSYYQRESQLQRIYNHPDEKKVMLDVAKSMLKQFLGKNDKEAKALGYDQAIKAAADKVIEILKQDQQSVAEGWRDVASGAFAGSDKNKLGSAGQWKNTGPSKNRPARAGDLVGGDSVQNNDTPIEEKIKGVDGKACWPGKRYAGRVKKADGTYKDKCIPVSENIQNAMDVLINKIIVNEAIQNNKR